MARAKIFRCGRSQAVILPKGFHLDGDEVQIRRHGNAVVLEPGPQDWIWLNQIVGPLDEDFERAVLERPEGPG